MDDSENTLPYLPPNYVSLADLQQRWLQQQKLKKEKLETQNQQTQPQPPKRDYKGTQLQQRQYSGKDHHWKPSTGLEDEGVKKFPRPNPNFKYRRHIRGIYIRNSPKKFREAEVTDCRLKPSKVEGDIAIGEEIDDGDHLTENQKEKDEKVLESEPSKKESIVTGDSGDIKKKRREIKKKKKKKKKKETMMNQEDPELEKKNLTVNGEVVKEEENGGKERNEVEVEQGVDDLTVEIRRRFEELNVERRGWRRGGRWRGGIERSRGVYHSYGRVVHRGVGRKRLENGLVWAKKGEVSRPQ